MSTAIPVSPFMEKFLTQVGFDIAIVALALFFAADSGFFPHIAPGLAEKAMGGIYWGISLIMVSNFFNPVADRASRQMGTVLFLLVPLLLLLRP